MTRTGYDDNGKAQKKGEVTFAMGLLDGDTNCAMRQLHS